MVFNKEKVVSNTLTLLGIKNDVLNKLVEKDEAAIKYYKHHIKLIPKCSKQLYRLRLMTISNDCIGIYVIKLVKKIVISVDLKTKIINDYWEKKNNNIDTILKELDELLLEYENKEYYCGCKRGTMCFSRKDNKWCNQLYK